MRRAIWISEEQGEEQEIVCESTQAVKEPHLYIDSDLLQADTSLIDHEYWEYNCKGYNGLAATHVEMYFSPWALANKTRIF